MSDRIDYRARLLFLRAAERIWKPAPLAALDEMTGDAVREWLGIDAGENWFEGRAFMMTVQQDPKRYGWRRLSDDTAESAVRAATGLRQWCAQYRIPLENEWILDAAIQSIGWAVAVAATGAGKSAPGQEPGLHWTIWPAEELRPAFRLPEGWADKWEVGEDPKKFQRRVRAEFNRHVKEYMARVRKLEGRRNRHDELHAEWTARVFAGEARAKIADGVRGGDEMTVNQAVWRFAKRTGLVMP